MFKVEKESLNEIKNWNFEIKVENNVINVQLTFEIVKRNKIIERVQNIIRKSPSLLKHGTCRFFLSSSTILPIGILFKLRSIKGI